ncbi:hypothetical protein TVAG_039830 [Trichomonas vaginalis G3]|uniref:Ankyrin repeat protein n=1 Tax=Trichomonas vaginalis (strain ATCC PRA-98 / G3) TaxID=412133 RepID=A2EQV7_TRIV3|nr:spectrin binding [Trichomonas vaginalis G3]EAY04931.1 hypothetical protein TVAG_039830 [Trichomonas vaginalis G3]KAI5508787.1 spectrin binding [Trichomonas vaginalis G3]|eukprot:XP_001317154.1 hypothetical protein [Trichomonas vaginalis G3]
MASQLENALLEAIHLDNTQKFRSLTYGKPGTLKVQDKFLTQITALSDSPGCCALAIAMGAPVNLVGDVMAPLNCSSYVGSMETAVLLIEAGARLNSIYKGETPVMLAVRYSTLDHVNLLLGSGADPCDIVYAGEYATDPKMLDLFINNGPLDDALEAAVYARKIDNVASLIQYGAKPSSMSLLTACCFNFAGIVKMLIEYGIKADDVAMQTCIYWNSIQAMEVLIEKGVPVIPFDIHYAILHNKPASLKRLLEEKVDLEAEIGGTYAIHTAVRHGRVDCLNILLEKGAKVNGADSLGCTPLHWAALRRKSQIMSILLDHGTIVNIEDPKVFQPQILEPDFGWTALHVSVEGPGFDTVRMLLDSSASQTKKWDGRTPLHTALFLNREDLIPLLITHGADLNATDVTNQTPVEYALSSGREDLAALIRKCASPDFAAANAAHGQFATKNATEAENTEFYEENGEKKQRKKSLSAAIADTEKEDDNADNVLQQLRSGEGVNEEGGAAEDDEDLMKQMEEMKKAQEGQKTDTFEREETDEEKKKRKQKEEDDELAKLAAELGSDDGADEDMAALMADLEIDAAQNADGEDEDMDKLMADLAADVGSDDDEDLDKLMSQMAAEASDNDDNEKK